MNLLMQVICFIFGHQWPVTWVGDLSKGEVIHYGDCSRCGKVGNRMKCGGVMQADLGSIYTEVQLECRACGATKTVDGETYALGFYDSLRCDADLSSQQQKGQSPP